MPFFRSFLLGGASLALLCAAPQSALAQSSADEFVAILEALAKSAVPPKFVTMQGVGSGTVVPGGTLFGSVSGTTEREDGSGTDGSFAFGAGFGDANEGLGVQLTANITSANPADIGDSGYLGVKVGTKLPFEAPTYVALSVDNLAGWGDSSENDVTASVALTRFGELSLGGSDYPTMSTLGIETIEGGDPSMFGGFGIGLTEYIGASVSHDSSNVNFGLGFKVPDVPGLSASITLDDAFENDGDRRATFSVSYSISDVF